MRENEKENTNLPAADKKIKKVVNGSVKTKTNEKRRLMNMFVSEDAANVKSYVLMDVLVPAIKKAISDIIVNGVDMILYGETRDKKKRSSDRFAYNSIYSKREDRVEPRYSTGNRFDYKDIIMSTRGEAEDMREQMSDIIDRYGLVTVADMYEMADIIAPHTSNKYGWTSVANARVTRVRDGFILELPKAMPID